MNKLSFTNVNQNCTLQNSSSLTSNSSPLEEGLCLTGVFSKTDNGFRFEESIRGHRDKRNPKLFDGNYCSLVHMQNGKYQIHMKTINASAISDPNDFAFKVYSELLSAFKVIE